MPGGAEQALAWRRARERDMNILLVDDSRTMRSILRGALEAIPGARFSEAGDGIEALSLLAQGEFDVVLIDWLMPRMDGLTLVKRIRQTNRALPLMMVTNQTDKSLVLMAIRAGVNGYLVKPFSPETITEKVLSAAHWSAAAVEAEA
jgi:two-component system chemotaxis response regulator CheY